MDVHRPAGHCLESIAVAGLVVLLAACAGPGSGVGTPSLEAETPQRLGELLLERFGRTLDLERLSVTVEDEQTATGTGSKVLRFDYYTPVGDRSFNLAIAPAEGGWRVDGDELAAVEARFAR